MNFDVIFNYMPMYTKAFLLTIKIGWIGIALSIGIGIVAAFILHFKIPVLSQIVKVYVALGMNRLQMFGSVILPQAFSISVPAIVANIIFLLKETSVFSAISLMDLMFTAKDLIGQYYNTTECLVMLVGFYIVMLLPVSILGSLVEHKARYRMFGD